MIKQVVRDYKTHSFENTKDVLEKLNYFRKVSADGLHNLSDTQLASLKSELTTFFNLDLAFFADTYPTKLFRLTNNKNLYGGQKVKLQKISDLLGPPKGLSQINRCNLRGESMFYAALNMETAIWETKPQKDDYITISEWKIKEGEKLFMHNIFHPEKTVANKESQAAFDAYIKSKAQVQKDLAETFEEILKFFCEEFMKPVREDQKINYLFPALMSSSLLRSEHDPNGLKIEAISYPSIKMDYELTNIAIVNSLVLERLDLVNIKVYMVTATNYDNPNKKAMDLIKVSPLILTITDFDFKNDKIDYSNSGELQMMIDLDEKYGQKNGR